LRARGRSKKTSLRTYLFFFLPFFFFATRFLPVNVYMIVDF